MLIAKGKFGYVLKVSAPSNFVFAEIEEKNIAKTVLKRFKGYGHIKSIVLRAMFDSFRERFLGTTLIELRKKLQNEMLD